MSDEEIMAKDPSTLEELQFVQTAIRDVVCKFVPSFYMPRDIDAITDKILSRIADYMTPEALTLLKAIGPEEK